MQLPAGICPAPRSRGRHGNSGQGHEQPDHIALTAGSGFTQHAFQLLANGPGGHAPQASDLFRRIAHQQTVGDFRFRWRQVIQCSERIVGKVRWPFRIGDEEQQVSPRTLPVRFGEGCGDQLQRALAGCTRESQEMAGLGLQCPHCTQRRVIQQLRECGMCLEIGCGKTAIGQRESVAVTNQGLRRGIPMLDASASGG